MTSSRFKLFKVISILLLAGCASPARVDKMTAATVSETLRTIGNSPLKENVAVLEVRGGKETNPIWMSNVGGRDFQIALEASLKAAGLFAENTQAGKYHLKADLTKMDQPFAGFDMTVTAHVRYELFDSTTGKSIFTKDISTPFTAKVSDAFMGVVRLKIANEGAARANISQFIDEISELNIPKISIKD